MFEDEDDVGWESDDMIKVGSFKEKVVLLILEGEDVVFLEDV